MNIKAAYSICWQKLLNMPTNLQG